MAITIIEDAILCVLLGIVLGVLASWLYVRTRMRAKTVSQVIEGAMISKNITELEVMSGYLNQIISRLKDCNDDLNDKLHSVEDIESSLASLPNFEIDIDEPDPPLKFELLEKSK